MSDDTEVIDDNAPEIPEIPEYNAKAIRRASRRGVARVALIAALIVGLGIAAVGIGTGVLARRSVDEQHMVETLAYGQLASHPGYRIDSTGPTAGDTSFGRLGQLDARVDFARFDPNGIVVSPGVSRVHKPLYGYPTLTEEIPSSPVEDVVNAAHPSKAKTRAVLDGLPASTACTAVIELASAADDEQYASLKQRLGIYENPDSSVTVDGVLLGPRVTNEPVPEGVSGEFDPDMFERVVGWSSGSPDVGPIEDFSAWARSLNDSDDDLLSQMSAGYVVDVAAAGDDIAIHGLVVYGATPDALRTLLARPEVASIAVADCDFNLELQFAAPPSR